MSDLHEFSAAAQKLDGDDAEEASGLYPSGAQLAEAPPADSDRCKPTHYKVICISMYTEDLKRLDSMVDALKSRGLTKANRSALIRYALGGIDLENVPKGL